MRIGFVVRNDSTEALRLCIDMIKYVEDLGFKPYIEEELRNVIPYDRTFRLGADLVNYVVVIGGDGTILKTLHRLKDLEIPLITFRVGSKGFLCDLEPHDYRYAFKRLINGEFRLVRYLRLLARVGTTSMPYVLNEYALVTVGFWRSKLAKLVILKDNDLIYEVLGDGVIVSTPIGSTAYNLAAGGPIVDPNVDAIIVTPLAPTTLNTRSVVLPSSTKVRIQVSRDSNPVMLIADGTLGISLRPNDEVEITRAPKDAIFVRFSSGDLYAKIFKG